MTEVLGLPPLRSRRLMVLVLEVSAPPQLSLFPRLLAVSLEEDPGRWAAPSPEEDPGWTRGCSERTPAEAGGLPGSPGWGRAGRPRE